MNFSFHPEAEGEFLKAIDFYENVEPGLGFDFALEVYSAIQRSAEYPDAWAVLEAEIRRSLVRRFPYGVLYAKKQNEILIVAVMNLHRDPDYLKERTF